MVGSIPSGFDWGSATFYNPGAAITWLWSNMGQVALVVCQLQGLSPVPMLGPASWELSPLHCHFPQGPLLPGCGAGTASSSNETRYCKLCLYCCHFPCPLHPPSAAAQAQMEGAWPQCTLLVDWEKLPCCSWQQGVGRSGKDMDTCPSCLASACTQGKNSDLLAKPLVCVELELGRAGWNGSGGHSWKLPSSSTAPCCLVPVQGRQSLPALGLIQPVGLMLPTPDLESYGDRAVYVQFCICLCKVSLLLSQVCPGAICGFEMYLWKEKSAIWCTYLGMWGFC